MSKNINNLRLVESIINSIFEDISRRDKIKIKELLHKFTLKTNME